jgi:site-specific recombinase XerC
LRLACAPAPDRDSASKKAVTADILALLLQACAGERLVDLRDRALLLTTFASGGRRRSEIAGLQVADLVDEESIRDDPNDANSPSLPAARNRQIGFGSRLSGKSRSFKDDKNVSEPFL